MLSLQRTFRLRCLLMSVALLFLAATAYAQLPEQQNVRQQPRDIDPKTIETNVTLELYGHPDTAHRRIEVRYVDNRVELSGAVASKSELMTAERMATFAVPDHSIVNRIQVEPDGPFLRVEGSNKSSPAELNRRFMDVLATKFPPEILRDVSLTAYQVEQPSALVVIVEGTLPTMREQLAISEALLHGSPAAAAVINRTHVVHGPVVVARPGVSVRGPFGLFGVDVSRRGGVAVDVGPLAIRAGRQNRVITSVADDPVVLDQYLTAVRSDSDLRSAQFRSQALGGVITLEGQLKSADKMRAVALAQTVNGVRGVVDRTSLLEGDPPYYRESDLIAYVRHRLGEHSAVRDIELRPEPNERFKLVASFATKFHQALATVVMANDAALSKLPIDLAFREDIPEPPNDDVPPSGSIGQNRNSIR